ncbi:hypothetical protein [Parendozoicomonas haliclonae]|uniref:hypothetical protein n=1 Tax=Parendozoicomonas haliclonae TaxID=1960125 RepID=UPI0039EE1287
MFRSPEDGLTLSVCQQAQKAVAERRVKQFQDAHIQLGVAAVKDASESAPAGVGAARVEPPRLTAPAVTVPVPDKVRDVAMSLCQLVHASLSFIGLAGAEAFEEFAGDGEESISAHLSMMNSLVESLPPDSIINPAENA